MSESEYNCVLAVDTATRRLNLALLYGGDRSVRSGEVVPRTHGQIMMKKIDELFQSAGSTAGDLEALVVGLGPGSFTGLRIGLAAVKGIAVARNLPAVGVTLFEIASDMISQGRALVVIPSRKDEYYVGICRDGAIADDDVHIMSETALTGAVASDPVYAIGHDPADFASDLLKQIVHRFEYDAGDVLRVGLEKLRRGEQADLIALEPVYLQKAIAEVRFDQRHGGG